MTQETLTNESFKTLWEKELLPKLKSEILKEIKSIRIEFNEFKESLKELNTRCAQIETSQNFISQQFDDTNKVIQETKKQNKALEDKCNHYQMQIGVLTGEVDSLKEDLDELQQYQRRDCLEIVGIPKLRGENPKQLFKELCASIHVDLDDKDISVVHRLPDTKFQKDRIIAKLVHREIKDEIYRSRKNLTGKTTRVIPSINKEIGQAIPRANKIFINESLTSQRKKLFNEAYRFKQNSDYKYLWTQNGKILLREN